MLGWAHNIFHKKRPGTRYAKLVFLHPLEFASHIVDSGASRPQNIDPLFFMVWWARRYFHKRLTETRDDELVFLPLMGSTGHLVHSGASGP
jgi:hypothetical protein